MPEPISAKPVPKLRPKSANKPSRPRPKTIHVDQDADLNSALGSRGARGSISNISGTLSAVARAFVLVFFARAFVFVLHRQVVKWRAPTRAIPSIMITIIPEAASVWPPWARGGCQLFGLRPRLEEDPLCTLGVTLIQVFIWFYFLFGLFRASFGLF